MSQNIYYPNAPIIEAVFDLQLLPVENFDSNCYDNLVQQLRGRFSFKGDIQEIGVGLHFSPGQKDISHSEKKIGIRLETADGKYVIQAKERGFTFSILRTYDSWEDFSKEAFKYWNIYRRIFKPKKITRQALRYINRIDVPELSFEMKNYFRVYPQVFEDDRMVQISGFFMQVQIPQSEGGVANLTQSIANPAKAGCSSIILDIDVFDNKQYSPGAKNLRKRIESLRDQKNSIFEKAITDKTRELIS